MSGGNRPRLGLFGRTYALVLACVLLAEVLIFASLLMTAPPMPPVAPFDTIVSRLEGRSDTLDLPISTRITANAPQNGDNETSRVLGLALDRALDHPAGSVRVRVDKFGPPATFGPQKPDAIANGERPMLVAGEFSVARPLPGGRWRVVATDGSFPRAASRRVLLLLVATLIAVAPCAYFLAHRLTRPIRRFANAAERLGSDPRTPPLAETGPTEIRMASEAFNRMQRRLASYVDERTTMIAAVAHDLRTPLMRMSFEIEDAPPKLRAAVGRQIEEMRDLIDAIVRFLHTERSRHEREPVDLAALLRRVAGDLADRGAVEIGEMPASFTILADPMGLRSVVFNLIGNALTYGGSARISLFERGGKTVIEVADRGPGLAEDQLERVFRPFYRVEPSRNRATGGIGLGLAIAKSIVVAHGGSVTLANREEGGLIARVELPKSTRNA